MRIIKAKKIEEAAAKLAVEANCVLRKDVLMALQQARRVEKGGRASNNLSAVIENARVAKKERLPVCQDTGMPCVFLEIGREVFIKGDLKKAVNNGIAAGYRKGFLRNSIVKDPLERKGSGYSPVVVHIDVAGGSSIKITVMPKGFGCENKTRLKMFNPTAGLDDIREFVVEAVKLSGANACPPYVVGVGIGGTADYACFMAKKALLKKVRGPRITINSAVGKLEKQLLQEINRLNIGPMGLGGKATCLGVSILRCPTHIAGLPVAVNISCHALRSASAIL